MFSHLPLGNTWEQNSSCSTLWMDLPGLHAQLDQDRDQRCSKWRLWEMAVLEVHQKIKKLGAAHFDVFCYFKRCYLFLIPRPTFSVNLHVCLTRILYSPIMPEYKTFVKVGGLCSAPGTIPLLTTLEWRPGVPSPSLRETFYQFFLHLLFYALPSHSSETITIIACFTSPPKAALLDPWGFLALYPLNQST